MAYAFASGGGALIGVGVGQMGITNWPITMFTWVRSTDMANLQSSLTYQQAVSPFNGLHLYVVGATDKLAFQAPSGAASSAATYSSGVWYALAGRGRATNDHDVVMDGVATTSTATGTYLSNLSEIRVGGRSTGGAASTNVLTGSTACPAIWNVALSDADIAMLVKGFSPRRVRPANLVWYAPLIRGLQKIVGAVGQNLSIETSAAPAAHPRIYGM
jgi:hypothetical protein